jgi:hypothetical protein
VGKREATAVIVIELYNIIKRVSSPFVDRYPGLLLISTVFKGKRTAWRGDTEKTPSAHPALDI